MLVGDFLSTVNFPVSLLSGTGSSHAAAASELVIQELTEGAIDWFKLLRHCSIGPDKGEGRAA